MQMQAENILSGHIITSVNGTELDPAVSPVVAFRVIRTKVNGKRVILVRNDRDVTELMLCPYDTVEVDPRSV
jgi:hypothetical protein